MIPSRLVVATKKQQYAAKMIHGKIMQANGTLSRSKRSASSSALETRSNNVSIGDHSFTVAAAAAVMTLTVLSSSLSIESKNNNSNNIHTNSSRQQQHHHQATCQCDTISMGSSSSSFAGGKKGKIANKNQPRNVMVHRLRSLRGRSLNEKYNVDWKNVLGEGAYGSVYPARLAATGEKVCSHVQKIM